MVPPFGLLWHRLLRPLLGPLFGRSRPYRLASATRENGLTTTLRLEPLKGSVPRYLPGQHLYLRFVGTSLPAEEHPFAISSSPSLPGALTVTIKAAGAYTNRLGELEPGARALVDAPHGGFSYLRWPDPRRHVFIAGGIGATPFLSMLNWMADRDSDRDLLFVWAVLSRDQLFGLADLKSFGTTFPRLKTVVVAEGDPLWTGEKGRVDRALLERLVPAFFGGEAFDWNSALYAVSGPPPMRKAVLSALRGLGVAGRNLRVGRFAR